MRRRAGWSVTVVDLDVVNPFFRSSDYRALLDEAGACGTIAPGVRPPARTSTGRACRAPGSCRAIERRRCRGGTGRTVVIVDAGGDDVGATALGRFARAVAAGPYEMLYVVNRSRNLTQEPAEAAEVLREIEAKSHLAATAVANNTHLQGDTDEAVVAAGIPYRPGMASTAAFAVPAATAFIHGAFGGRRPCQDADRQFPNGFAAGRRGGAGLSCASICAELPGNKTRERAALRRRRMRSTDETRKADHGENQRRRLLLQGVRACAPTSCPVGILELDRGCRSRPRAITRPIAPTRTSAPVAPSCATMCPDVAITVER